MVQFPNWFERGRSSQHMTHEQILKLARRRPVFVGKCKPQPDLRKRCDQLVEIGMLRRTAEHIYIIR